MKSLAAIIMAVVLATCACERAHDNTEVPRRPAYPRPALLDSVMKVPSIPLPVHFEVNAAAVTTSPRRDWLDVIYPSYNATLHISFTDTDAQGIDAVRENRLERLMLNTGDSPSQHSEFVNNAGFDILTVITEGSATPVQFLATDGSSVVVSGVVYFSDPKAVSETDSISPYIHAIKADIDRSLASLRNHD